MQRRHAVPHAQQQRVIKQEIRKEDTAWISQRRSVDCHAIETSRVGLEAISAAIGKKRKRKDTGGRKRATAMVSAGRLATENRFQLLHIGKIYLLVTLAVHIFLTFSDIRPLFSLCLPRVDDRNINHELQKHHQQTQKCRGYLSLLHGRIIQYHLKHELMFIIHKNHAQDEQLGSCYYFPFRNQPSSCPLMVVPPYLQQHSRYL